MKHFATIIFTILIFLSCNKIEVTQNVKQQSESPQTFDTLEIISSLIKQKYPKEEVFKIFKGDLNLDNLEDIVAIIEKEPDSTENLTGLDGEKARKVIFLLNRKLSNYVIAAANGKMIECSTCGGAGIGDPLQDITIKNGFVDFCTMYGSCDKTIFHHIFKYDRQKLDWFIYKTTQADYSCKDTIGEVDVRQIELNEKQLEKISFREY